MRATVRERMLLSAVLLLLLGCRQQTKPSAAMYQQFNEISEKFYFYTNYMPQPVASLIYFVPSPSKRLELFKRCKESQLYRLSEVRDELERFPAPAQLNPARSKSLKLMDLAMKNLVQPVDEQAFSRAEAELALAFPHGFDSSPTIRAATTADGVEYEAWYRAFRSFLEKCNHDLEKRLHASIGGQGRIGFLKALRSDLSILAYEVDNWKPVHLQELKDATLKYLDSCNDAVHLVGGSTSELDIESFAICLIKIQEDFNRIVSLIIASHLSPPSSLGAGGAFSDADPPRKY